MRIILIAIAALTIAIGFANASPHGYPSYYGFDNRSRGFTGQTPEYWENPNHVYPGERRGHHYNSRRGHRYD